jgi:hypothetical protein
MRIDPQDGGLDDWVAPAPAPTRPAGQGAPVMWTDPQDGGLDDWVAPAPAPSRPAAQVSPVTAIDPQDGGLDDWIPPTPSPAPGAAQPAPSPQPSVAGPGTSNPPAGPPDLRAAYWSLIPASRAGAMAWHPPIFLPSNPFSPENIPASKWVTPPPIFLNSPGQLPLTPPAPPNVPRTDAGHSLLGALANLQSVPSDPPNAAAHGLLGALANL